MAGEPQLYGWIYYYANEVFYIFLAAAAVCWILLYLYFHDWRGALRPTITGVVSAFWGLGIQAMMGFSMDPLALVIPFFVTARAISHSVQMHERYYEEYHKWQWNKEKAIVAAFAELFVPTLSGIITDSLGMLVIVVCAGGHPAEDRHLGLDLGRLGGDQRTAHESGGVLLPQRA